MTLFLVVGIGMLLLSLPYLGRVIAGPTIFDRLVAMNAIGTKVSVLVVVVGLLYNRVSLFVDIAIGFFLLNLVTTLLIARLVKEKGKI